MYIYIIDIYIYILVHIYKDIYIYISIYIYDNNIYIII